MRPKWNTTSPQPMYRRVARRDRAVADPEHLLLVEGDVQAVHRVEPRPRPSSNTRSPAPRPTGDPSTPGHHRTTPHGHRRHAAPNDQLLDVRNHRHQVLELVERVRRTPHEMHALDLATAGQLNHRADAADLDALRPGHGCPALPTSLSLSNVTAPPRTVGLSPNVAVPAPPASSETAPPTTSLPTPPTSPSAPPPSQSRPRSAPREAAPVV